MEFLGSIRQCEGPLLTASPFFCDLLCRSSYPQGGIDSHAPNSSDGVKWRLTEFLGKELQSVGDHGLAALGSVIGLHDGATHEGYAGGIAKMVTKLEAWNDGDHVLVLA